MEKLLKYIFESIDKDAIDRFKEELENSSYSEFVDKLKDMCKDPKTLGLIKAVFGGKYSDTKMSKNERPKVAKALQPTQNEISIVSTLKRGCSEIEYLDDLFNSPVILKGQPIITFNRNYIIDGHHRWSKVAAFNPTGKMVVLNFDNDEMNAIEMLKASQGTIAADTNNVPESTVESENLFTISVKDVTEKIDEWLTDEVVERLGDYVKSVKDRKSAIKYIVNNVKKIQANNQPVKNAPDRDDMPQTHTDPNFEDTIKNTTKIHGDK